MDIAYGSWPTWWGAFEPYGAEIDTNVTTNNYKFSGKERDTESGLDYSGASSLPRGEYSMKILKIIAAFVIVFVLALAIFLGRAIWYTSVPRMMGEYQAEGAWGTSSLTLRADHTFHQSVTFANQFNGKAEGTKSTSGVWVDKGRTLLSKKIEFSSFVSPSPLNDQNLIKNFDTTYGVLGTSFGIEVDPGANIYYWKQR